MHRLETLSPDFARFFEQLPIAQRRSLVASACQKACGATGVTFETAVRELIGIGEPDQQTKRFFATLSEELDEKYFAADDQMTRSMFFKKARAAAAVAFALDDAEDLLRDAVYEAVMAHKDPGAVARILMSGDERLT
jgi:hypothetical protein